jgi:hypothetical protein
MGTNTIILMERMPVKFSDELILNKIYQIRGQNVMIDSDLAELYDVPTKRLNEQVKRNIERFPEDFMFQLTEKEFENLKSQFATSSWGGRRKLPFAFTEHGVLMLSSALNSDRAIKVNIQIMRIYSKIRHVLLSYKDILVRVERLENTIAGHDEHILLIFEYLKQLEQEKIQRKDQEGRRRIGFKK